MTVACICCVYSLSTIALTIPFFGNYTIIIIDIPALALLTRYMPYELALLQATLSLMRGSTFNHRHGRNSISWGL